MTREQTEALPTRDLRPANVAGGQYRVAVQQAPESGYTKLGAQIGLGSEDGKWRVSIIGDNLTDERIKVIGGTIPLARTFVRLASGGALDGIAYDAIYARPRNIAIKLDYTF